MPYDGNSAEEESGEILDLRQELGSFFGVHLALQSRGIPTHDISVSLAIPHRVVRIELQHTYRRGC
jgi:hypothetical protein